MYVTPSPRYPVPTDTLNTAGPASVPPGGGAARLSERPRTDSGEIFRIPEQKTPKRPPRMVPAGTSGIGNDEARPSGGLQKFAIQNYFHGTTSLIDGLIVILSSCGFWFPCFCDASH
jgi:hypothetical protein